MNNELAYRFTKFPYDDAFENAQVDFSFTNKDMDLNEIVEEFQRFLSAAGFSIDPGSVLMFTSEESTQEEANLKRDQDEWMDFTMEQDGWLKANKAEAARKKDQETPDPKEDLSNFTKQLELEQQKLREKAVWDGCPSVSMSERDNWVT